MVKMVALENTNDGIRVDAVQVNVYSTSVPEFSPSTHVFALAAGLLIIPVVVKKKK